MALREGDFNCISIIQAKRCDKCDSSMVRQGALLGQRGPQLYRTQKFVVIFSEWVPFI
jgi:hypothetical protein